MKHVSNSIYLVICICMMLISSSVWSQDTRDSLSSSANASNENQTTDLVQEAIQENAIIQELDTDDSLATASFKPKALEFKIPLTYKEHPVFKNLYTDPVIKVESYRTPKKLETAFLISVLGLLLVSFLFYNNRGYLSHLITAYKNPNLTQRQLKELIQQDSLVNGIFNILALFSFGFYSFVIFKRMNFEFTLKLSDTQLLLSFMLLFILGYGLRVLFQKMIGYIFQINDEMNIYIFQLLLTAKILGILLIPFTIVLYFGEGNYLNTLVYLSLFLILISLSLKYLRSGFLFKAFIGFSKFHFILYLCASEILPFLILLKLFMVI